MCRVSHVFPLLAVALVVWLVALMTFGTGGRALLSMVAALLVRTRYPGLEEKTEKVSLSSLQDFPQVFKAIEYCGIAIV